MKTTSFLSKTIVLFSGLLLASSVLADSHIKVLCPTLAQLKQVGIAENEVTSMGNSNWAAVSKPFTFDGKKWNFTLMYNASVTDKKAAYAIGEMVLKDLQPTSATAQHHNGYYECLFYNDDSKAFLGAQNPPNSTPPKSAPNLEK